MRTLDECFKFQNGMRSLSTYGAFFDLISFVEESKHRYEYEWRIASGHNLASDSYLPKIERLRFSFADVHSFYVSDEGKKNEFFKFLKSINDDEVRIPQVFLTNEIILTDEEINQIEKIKTRST